MGGSPGVLSSAARLPCSTSSWRCGVCQSIPTEIGPIRFLHISASGPGSSKASEEGAPRSGPFDRGSTVPGAGMTGQGILTRRRQAGQSNVRGARKQKMSSLARTGPVAAAASTVPSGWQPSSAGCASWRTGSARRSSGSPRSRRQRWHSWRSRRGPNGGPCPAGARAGPHPRRGKQQQQQRR